MENNFKSYSKAALIMRFFGVSLIIAITVFLYFYSEHQNHQGEHSPLKGFRTFRGDEKLNLEWLSGKDYFVLDGKNNPSLITFWALWCEPCLLELPQIKQLKMIWPQIQIVAINLDKSKEDKISAREYWSKNQMNFKTIFFDQIKTKMSVPNPIPFHKIYDSQSNLSYTVSGKVDWLSPPVKDLLKPLFQGNYPPAEP